MTDTNTETGPWTLRAHGRTPWPQARELLADCTCTWTDLDGLQLGPAPGDAPITTHLWAWDPTRHFRARFDGDTTYLAELRCGDTTGESVTVRRQRSYLRLDVHARSGPLSDLAIELLEIPGARPVTFLRAAG